jgi:hypothetical protein
MHNPNKHKKSGLSSEMSSCCCCDTDFVFSFFLLGFNSLNLNDDLVDSINQKNFYSQSENCKKIKK